VPTWYNLISQNVSINCFFKSQLPHKIVNLLFTTSHQKQLADGFVGGLTFQNHSINTLCEIKPMRRIIPKRRASLDARTRVDFYQARPLKEVAQRQSPMQGSSFSKSRSLTRALPKRTAPSSSLAS
jgi:hypothetical protein